MCVDGFPVVVYIIYKKSVADKKLLGAAQISARFHVRIVHHGAVLGIHEYEMVLFAVGRELYTKSIVEVVTDPLYSFLCGLFRRTRIRKCCVINCRDLGGRIA